MFASKSDENNLYRGFMFLVETKLDDDLAQLKVDLMLRLGRMATASFSPAGKIALTSEQVTDMLNKMDTTALGLPCSLGAFGIAILGISWVTIC